MSLSAQRVHLPVGDVRHVNVVEAGTVIVVLVAFVWIGRKIVALGRRMDGVAPSRVKEE